MAKKKRSAKASAGIPAAVPCWGAVVTLADGVTEIEIRVPKSKMSEAQFREHVEREKAK